MRVIAIFVIVHGTSLRRCDARGEVGRRDDSIVPHGGRAEVCNIYVRERKPASENILLPESQPS